jgi:hypothetical protein
MKNLSAAKSLKLSSVCIFVFAVFMGTDVKQETACCPRQIKIMAD